VVPSSVERSPHHRPTHDGKHVSSGRPAGGKHAQGQGRGKGASFKSKRRRFSRPSQQVRGAQSRTDDGERRNPTHSDFGFMRQS
jgi:hypothetical protein